MNVDTKATSRELSDRICSSRANTDSTRYWNWGKYADPSTSPIFNGDAYSMGGNGESVKHKGGYLGMAFVNVPAGKGGGCVKTGPFAKYVNISQILDTILISQQYDGQPRPSSRINGRKSQDPKQPAH